jgi:hypothetical protein
MRGKKKCTAGRISNGPVHEMEQSKTVVLSEEGGNPNLTYDIGLIGSHGIWLCSCIGCEYDLSLHTCGIPCALRGDGVGRGDCV